MTPFQKLEVESKWTKNEQWNC